MAVQRTNAVERFAFLRASDKDGSKTHTKARRAAVNLIGPIDWKGAIDPIATERYHGAR